jgi:hypothetical protein
MKLLTLFAAVCLLGTTSCSQKLCPAYSKANVEQQHNFAKDDITSKTTSASRI